MNSPSVALLTLETVSRWPALSGLSTDEVCCILSSSFFVPRITRLKEI